MQSKEISEKISINDNEGKDNKNYSLLSNIQMDDQDNSSQDNIAIIKDALKDKENTNNNNDQETYKEPVLDLNKSNIDNNDKDKITGNEYAYKGDNLLLLSVFNNIRKIESKLIYDYLLDKELNQVRNIVSMNVEYDNEYNPDVLD